MKLTNHSRGQSQNSTNQEIDELHDYQNVNTSQVKKNVDLLSNLERTFDLFDINKDGYIDIQDLQEMLQSLNEDISMEDIALMMNDIESDIPGRITFEEFAKRIVTRYKEKQETKSTLTNALKVFDADELGYIKADQLRQIIVNLDEELEEVIDDIIDLCHSYLCASDEIGIEAFDTSPTNKSDSEENRIVKMVNYEQFVENLIALL